MEKAMVIKYINDKLNIKETAVSKKRLFAKNKDTIFLVNDVRNICHIEGARYKIYDFYCTSPTVIQNETLYIDLSVDKYLTYEQEYKVTPYNRKYGRVTLKENPRVILDEALSLLKELISNNKVFIKWL